MTARAYEFDLSGGRVCLDFANTVSGRIRDEPVDHLGGYGALLAFARQAGVITPGAARALGAVALRRAAQACAALERAIAVREAIYRVFLAIAEGSRPGRADVGVINDALPAALSRLRLVEAPRDAAPGGPEIALAWGWDGSADDLEAPLAPIVRSAAELLTSAEAARVRVCELPTCAWLFVDTSKNRSRRWCDMKICGNRAKARRHHARARAQR